MAALPFMPLFIGDYLADTMALTTEQHGAYLLLLMSYWKNGPLPDDDGRLAATCRLSVDAWSMHKHALAPLFDIRDGQWFNRRQDRERELAAEKKAKSSSKSKAAAAARWKDAPKNDARGNAKSNAPSNAPSMPEAMREECPSSSSSIEEEMESGTTIETLQKSRSPTPTVDRTGVRSLADQFAEFWDRFPNKVGRKAAEQKFRLIAKRGEVTFADLMAGLERYLAKTDDRPWCNPSTWLNQGRWSDEPAAPTTIGGLHVKPSARVQHARNAFGRVIQRALDDEGADVGRTLGGDRRVALLPPVDGDGGA